LEAFSNWAVAASRVALSALEKKRENLSPRPKRKKKKEKNFENYKEKEKIERKGLPGDKEARRIWLNWGLDMT